MFELHKLIIRKFSMRHFQIATTGRLFQRRQIVYFRTCTSKLSLVECLQLRISAFNIMLSRIFQQ